ncbi:MAG TPA: 6-hydroxymethylpterin diphosphokinase MptE-like protein, partial [Spirochaetia bacterium]|nr:6-hydroxymethylpterin diphosphokinase MptE-like protein [Spirochaetia bacterium]
VVRSWLLREEVNHNTLNRFGRLWVKNLGRNARSLAAAPGISRLKDLCRGLPALVVAGGPSLDEVLPSLAALRERLVIISVATPLRRCVQAGVRPDFVVVVDPQYWASRFMDWALPAAGGTEGPLPVVVAEPSTHPRLLRQAAPDGRVETSVLYLSSSLFPLGEALEAAVGEKGKLGAGGSVSTAAWDLARHLGASPIYTAGLDLGYPGMRTHCRGVFTEELWLSACGRLRPVESSSFGYLREIGLFPVRSAGGGITLTDRRMLLYMWWFENQLSLQHQASTFTLCPGSVGINGMPLAPVSDLMSLPVIRDQIDERLGAELARGEARTASSAKVPALRDAMNGLLAGLDELAALSERALKANQELGAALRRTGKGAAKARALLQELDQIDARILDVSHRGIAGFLMQAVIRRIEGRGEKETSREQTLSDGEQLYRAILESAQWQKKIITRALSEL